MRKDCMLKTKKTKKTSFLKKVINFFQDNVLQILESFMLVVVFSLPYFINIKGIFDQYLKENYPTPDNAFQYFLIQSGKTIIALVVLLIALSTIRKHNKEKIVNRKDFYHNYPYIWYWYCAKVLGFGKCNLVLVPIYMQFKLVNHSVFDDFPLDENSYPIEDNSDINVTKTNWASNPSEINIILEDTYPILDTQIPSTKNKLPTIKISRNDGKSFERHYSQKYIESVITQVRGLNSGIKVNVFATTNPLNTFHIVKRAFTNGNRGNISCLYVFQQDGSGERLFSCKGKKIFQGR